MAEEKPETKPLKEQKRDDRQSDGMRKTIDKFLTRRRSDER